MAPFFSLRNILLCIFFVQSFGNDTTTKKSSTTTVTLTTGKSSTATVTAINATVQPTTKKNVDPPTKKDVNPTTKKNFTTSTKSSTFKEDGTTCTKDHADCAQAAACFDESTGACDAKTGKFTDTDNCKTQEIAACFGCFPYSMCGSKGAHLRKIPSSSFKEDGKTCTKDHADCAQAAACFDESTGACDAKTGKFTDTANCKSEQLTACFGCFPYSTCGSKGAHLPSSTYKQDGETCTADHAECAQAAACFDESTGACDSKTGLFTDNKNCKTRELTPCFSCFPYSMCGSKGAQLRKPSSAFFDYGPNCQTAEHGCRLAYPCFDEDKFCDAKTGTFKDIRCKVGHLKHCRECYQHSMCGAKGAKLRGDAPTSSTLVVDGKCTSQHISGCGGMSGCFDENSGRCDARTGLFTKHSCKKEWKTLCGHCYPYSACGSKKIVTKPPAKVTSPKKQTTTTTAGPKTTKAPVVWSDTPANLVKKFAGSDASTSNSQIDGKWEATWAFNKAGDDQANIFLAIEAVTTGWVGFALAEAAGMRGADVVMAYVGSDGKAYAGDYHATANGQPIKDGCQDWSILYGEEHSGSTLVVLSRPLITSDSNDRPIFTSGFKRTSLLAAFGSTDDISIYHGANRAKFYVDIASGSRVNHASWSAAKAADPNLKAIELKANEASVLSEPPWRMEDFQKPQAGGQLLPPVRTVYWQYCFTDREEFDQTGWITAFEGIADGSPRNVHHIVLFAFDKPGCLADSNMVSVWSGGVTLFEDFPTDVGMSLLRYKSYRMEMHYDNPELRNDLKDNSGGQFMTGPTRCPDAKQAVHPGILTVLEPHPPDRTVRLWVSTKKPKHEAGILELADPKVDLMGMRIDSGRTSWTFTCSGEETKKLLPHKITLTDSTGKTKRVNAVEYFDFDHQDLTLLERYVVSPGDTLTTRCYYNNPANNDLRFGLGSDEEMCIDFLLYYPAFESSGKCASEASATNAFMTKKILSSSYSDARVFGVEPGAPDGAQCKGSVVTVTTTTTVDPAGVDDTCVAVLGSAGAALSFVATALMN